VPQTDGGERAFNRIGRANVTRVLRWKIEERQQHIAVFLQAFHRLFVLRFKGRDEQVESLSRCVLRAGLPDVVQHPFCLGLNILWQFVEHVGRLVIGTPLKSLIRFALVLETSNSNGFF
jgi:hypothetical protein